MNLFGARKPEPAASTALTVAPPQSPTSPFPAPKATEIESLVRSAIWGKLSPELGRVVNLNVAELLEWVSGARRLTQPQVMALARKIGVVDSLETGVDAIRSRLIVEMKKRPNFDWIDFPGGARGEERLRDFASGADCLTLPELTLLAKEFYGKHVGLDPQTAMLRSEGPAPVSMGAGPGTYVPRVDAYPPVVTGREQMSFYPAAPEAERKPAKLSSPGWA